MLRLWRLSVAAGLVTCISSLAAQERGFEHVADYRGVGATLTTTVGPGRQKDALYASYIYGAGEFHILQIDPDTAKTQVFPSPLPTEQGAYGMVVGPDKKMYFGTLPNAHLMELDPRGNQIQDLGRPSPTEEYIWDLCVGSDNQIYGSTFPNAKLIRYDPATHRMSDLGRLDPAQQYARSIAASRDGFIYAGIGSSAANIAAYQISTGERREILNLNPSVAGFAQVYATSRGTAYAQLNGQHYRLQQWTATRVSDNDAEMAAQKNQLADGRSVVVTGRMLQVNDPSGGQPHTLQLDYGGGKLSISRLAANPAGDVYGSTAMPLRLFQVHAKTREITTLGEFGKGELYSAIYLSPYFYMTAYSAQAPLLRFDPRMAIVSSGPGQNPVSVHYSGEDDGWRPKAITIGPDGRIYVGAEPGYGRLGGALVAWDPASNSAKLFATPVQDQSVEALTTWKNLLVGGSSIRGGAGTQPTQKQAVLFLWDPATTRVIYSTVPVPGADSITSLISMPNGIIFGVAGNALFAFNAAQRAVIPMAQAPSLNSPVYGALVAGPDGRVWGLDQNDVFAIDPSQRKTYMQGHCPCQITAGVGLVGNSIYFACGASVWRYTP